MGLFNEFKKFALRGNVMDMAVGIVIGAAFGKIVSSLVEQIVSPLAGYLTGGVNLADRAFTLPVPDLVAGMAPPVIGWGAFVQAIVDFLIVAFAIFLAIKGINALYRNEQAAPPPTEEIVLLREIRDSLARR
jgi:large conductance mechanosensitive channel